MGRVRVALIAALLVGLSPLRLGAADVVHAVDPTPTSTFLVNPAEIAVVSWSVTYTVAVSPNPDGGTYSFQVDGETVATKPWAEGFTQFTTSFGTTGTHTVQVLFGGTAAYAASASQLAEIDIIPPYPTSVTIEGTPNPVGRNADVEFTATVVPNPGPGDIEWIYDGGVVATTPLAEDGTATHTTSFDTAGSSAIWARFTGNENWSPRTSDLYQELVLVGTYYASELGGALYYSQVYPRGRILDAGPMDHGCTDCAFITGRFTYQLVTSGALAYRSLYISPRGHGFNDREHTGTLYLEHPTTHDFILPMSLPMYDQAGVTHGIPFTTSVLSPTKSLVAWIWMDAAWGDAYDLNFVRLSYQYAVWR